MCVSFKCNQPEMAVVAGKKSMTKPYTGKVPIRKLTKKISLLEIVIFLRVAF